MEPVKRTRVKICCIMTRDEMRLAVRYGASAVGLVSAMPSGPGIINEDVISQIADEVPPGVSSFLLTSSQDPRDIVRQQRKCRTNTIQICDSLDAGAYGILRNELPGISLVQVFHINEGFSLDSLDSLPEEIDAVLLDSGNQFKRIKELGGTGRTHDWRISRAVRERLKIPIYLAGGLNPDNIREAIETVRPFGVDICSGVRTEGRLDENKLAAFVGNVSGTFE
jgi:phosphoribosylanthranilate isomerase